MNEEIWQKTGRAMVESWREKWQGMKAQLWVYWEDKRAPDFSEDERVKGCYLQESPWLLGFKQRHRHPVVNGVCGNSYLYRRDAVKFAHKVAAVHAAALKMWDSLEDSSQLVWLDADLVWKESMTEEWWKGHTPGEGVGMFVRDGFHTETGIVVYNVRDLQVQWLVRMYAQTYERDALFRLEWWDDCTILDAVVAAGQKMGYELGKNLGDEKSRKTAHPIVNSEWFEVVDHLKGKRKEGGKSYESDRVV